MTCLAPADQMRRDARHSRRARDAVVPAALPADQGAARAKPRGGRVAPGRGDPVRDSSSRRASAYRRARCARRSTRWPPTTSSCAGKARARSSRRTPRSSASTFRFLRIRRNDGKDEYPGSRLLDVRRAKASVRGRAPAASCARAIRSSCSAACSNTRGEPVVLDEITLPAALFRGLTKAKYDAYRGSMYGFFETQFGVRMLKAQEKLRAVAADAAARRSSASPPGSPLLAVDRVTLTFGDRPVEVRRGLCATRHHHYRERLDLSAIDAWRYNFRAFPRIANTRIRRNPTRRRHGATCTARRRRIDIRSHARAPRSSVAACASRLAMQSST